MPQVDLLAGSSEDACRSSEGSKVGSAGERRMATGVWITSVVFSRFDGAAPTASRRRDDEATDTARQPDWRVDHEPDNRRSRTTRTTTNKDEQPGNLVTEYDNSNNMKAADAPHLPVGSSRPEAT